MNWSDETLMAFADGELDAAQAALLQIAMQNDPDIGQRVDDFLHQRQRLGAAFGAVLDEPVPEHLLQLLRTPVDSYPTMPSVAKPRRKSSFLAAWGQRLQGLAQQVWRPSNAGTWGALAAGVMLGVLFGTQWTGVGNSETGLAMHGGRLLADGPVAQALASQLANEAHAGQAVAVQLSFVDRSGQYCRTFTTAAVAGLACLEAGAWTVEHLTAADRHVSGEVRQAGAELPTALLDAVDQRIAGAPFDVANETAARARGWKQ